MLALFIKTPLPNVWTYLAYLLSALCCNNKKLQDQTWTPLARGLASVSHVYFFVPQTSYTFILEEPSCNVSTFSFIHTPISTMLLY